ncbi:MAG TPA: TonB-dependent receptor [Polyangiaceae bacterium]|nr:TonB-dependent receptor [Polyangiaceae bacterium]
MPAPEVAPPAAGPRVPEAAPAAPTATTPAAPALVPAPELPAASPGGMPLDDASLEPGTSAEHGKGEGLEEVVVTVDRRKKDLQKYSGTAQAFSENRLTQVGINGVQGLASMVPGLEIATDEGNTEVYIRGVGNDNNAEHGDMGVAVHLDGVYLPRPRGVGSLFYDIERVEVNSGPQGTLRGRNAQGGSINIITNKPKLGEFGANAEATFGTFAERRYQGMVNIPIGDTLALRFAGFTSVHDPHWQNGGPIYDLPGAQSENTYAFRGQLKWQPTKPLVVTAGYDFTHEGGTGYIGANYNAALNHQNDNGTPTNTTDDTPASIPPSAIKDPRDIYQLGLHPSVNMKHQGGRLEVNYDTGPVIVEGLLSYRDLVYKEIDGGSAGVIYPGFNYATQGTDFFGTAYWDTRSQSVVAELRAFAPDTARLRWTGGLFMLRENQQVVLYQTNDPANGYGGAEFNMPNVYGNSMAGYADATFDMTPRFRVIGGVRLTTETKGRKDGIAIQGNNFPGDGGHFGTPGFAPAYHDRPTFILPQGATAEERVNLFLDGIRSFGARDALPQALCNDPPQAAPGQPQTPRVAPDAQGALRCTSGVRDSLVAGNGFGISAVPQNAEVQNTFLDYRAGIEFDAAKNSLVYATVSTAHKAAGYNDTVLRPDGLSVYNEYYDPEHVTAFEIGSKNLLADRRFRANAAAFMYIYDDQVFQQIVQIGPPDPVSGQAPVTSERQNAANSNIYGLDIDLMYALPLGFEVAGHALLLDARYGNHTLVQDSRIDYNVGNYQVDIKGNWLPRASPYTFNYSLSQLVSTSIGSFNWLVQGQTVGRYYLTVFNGHGNLLPEATGHPPAPGVSAAYDQLKVDASRLTDVQPTYTRFDLSAGWTHPDGRLSIGAFVNNLFNIAYTTTIISTPNLNLRFFNDPRTAGVRVRVEW